MCFNKSISEHRNLFIIIMSYTLLSSVNTPIRYSGYKIKELELDSGCLFETFFQQHTARSEISGDSDGIGYILTTPSLGLKASRRPRRTFSQSADWRCRRERN